MGSITRSSIQERSSIAPSTPSELGAIEVEIVELKKFDRGALRGWVDLIIQPIGLKFNGVAFFQKDGKEWLKLPQREYELNGERRFSPIAEFDNKDAHDRFQGAALAALGRFRREGGGL